MSAPTSLTLSAKEQQAALYSSCQLKTSIGELSSISENGGNKTSARSSHLVTPQDTLIESKFNELARKILEELRQAQYSKDFFKTLDDIIKEPVSKSFVPAQRANGRQKRSNHQQRYLNNYSSSASRQQVRADQFQYSNDQPRSLPIDVTHLIQQQQHLKQQQQLQQKQQQQLQSSPQQRQQQKSAIPIINGYSSPKKGIVAAGAEDKVSQNGHSYPISRSSTVGEANLKRQQQQQQSIGLRKSLTLISHNSNNNTINNNHEVEQSKAKASDTGCATGQRQVQKSSSDMFSKLVNRRLIDENDGDDDDEEEEEDDDDDEDDDDHDEDDDYRQANSRQRQVYQNQRFNPIAKSKTLSDTTNISSEMSMLAKKGIGTRLQAPTQQQQSQQQTQQQQSQKLRQRFNPIVRSNTITASASQRPVANHQHHQERELATGQNSHAEPKSMVLSSKDIGSLYKPHMNYSTSVLGNHRLSDDDEIIIIPTQSPSLVSTSPDGDANVDELTERFSISRTKSFWEKLSKGNHGRRPVDENSRPDSGTTATGGAKINQHHQAANKVGKTGSRISGHQSHTLDRMDSTGGSNSNYSCSSSGDENSGCHSQQNATVSQLQEMSRQNRFRQTR